MQIQTYCDPVQKKRSSRAECDRRLRSKFGGAKSQRALAYVTVLQLKQALYLVIGALPPSHYHSLRRGNQD